MAEEIFSLNNVKKRYGARTVLDVPDLKIFKGKIYGILGPNGAGKSTLLKILNLIEKPSSGQIFFEKEEVNYKKNLLSLQRRMTMVFQKPYLYAGSVQQNVALGLKLRKYKKEDYGPVVKEALTMVGMVEFANQDARTLSGGEAQRVALARAIAIKPEVLLMDEPTASLDPDNVKIIEDLILKINRNYGTTIILVTHNLFQARRISEELVFLHEGKLIETGPAEKLFEKTDNPRTRIFLSGQMVY